MSTHPVTRGALCPLAFGAHQLNWHPLRLRAVSHNGAPASWSDAQAAFAKACKEGPVAVIDGWPGRAPSAVLEDFMRRQGGEYRVVAAPETRSLFPYERWTGVPAGSMGYDWENARTIVSFGAPLLDGWGAPGQFSRLWAERAAGMSDPYLRLIQIEPTFSRTAARAWQWISIREGSESALAAGLARVLLEQKLVSAHGPIPPMSLADAAAQTGLTADAIGDLAHAIASHMPALAICGDDNPAVAALNVLLGAVGSGGGIVRTSKNPAPHLADEKFTRNARAVLIDASVPWNFVPQTDGEVFRFAAWNGESTKADWLMPAPGFLEELTDVPSAPASAVETYAVAPSLTKPASDVRSAAQFVGSLDPALQSAESVIHSRCANIFRTRGGKLCAQETVRVAEIASAQKLEEQLWKGAVWVADPLPDGGLHCRLEDWPENKPPARPENWASAWTAPILPPLASKLYLESSLREAPPRRNA